MAERTDELVRGRSGDADVESSEAAARGAGPRARAGRRVRGRLAAAFSLRFFGGALVLATAGLLAASSLVPFVPVVGGLAGLLGVFAATFTLGLVTDRRRYLEAGLAGAAAAGLGSLLNHLVLAVLVVGLPMVVFGAGSGFVAGVLGLYFGRDLRDGVTREL